MDGICCWCRSGRHVRVRDTNAYEQGRVTMCTSYIHTRANRRQRAHDQMSRMRDEDALVAIRDGHARVVSMNLRAAHISLLFKPINEPSAQRQRTPVDIIQVVALPCTANIAVGDVDDMTASAIARHVRMGAVEAVATIEKGGVYKCTIPIFAYNHAPRCSWHVVARARHVDPVDGSLDILYHGMVHSDSVLSDAVPLPLPVSPFAPGVPASDTARARFPLSACVTHRIHLHLPGVLATADQMRDSAPATRDQESLLQRTPCTDTGCEFDHSARPTSVSNVKWALGVQSAAAMARIQSQSNGPPPGGGDARSARADSTAQMARRVIADHIDALGGDGFVGRFVAAETSAVLSRFLVTDPKDVARIQQAECGPEDKLRVAAIQSFMAVNEAIGLCMKAASIGAVLEDTNSSADSASEAIPWSFNCTHGGSVRTPTRRSTTSAMRVISCAWTILTDSYRVPCFRGATMEMGRDTIQSCIAHAFHAFDERVIRHLPETITYAGQRTLRDVYCIVAVRACITADSRALREVWLIWIPGPSAVDAAVLVHPPMIVRLGNGRITGPLAIASRDRTADGRRDDVLSDTDARSTMVDWPVHPPKDKEQVQQKGHALRVGEFIDMTSGRAGHAGPTRASPLPLMELLHFQVLPRRGGCM